MSGVKVRLIRRICIIAGVVLLIAATSLLIFWQTAIRTAEEKSRVYVENMMSIIPQPESAVPTERLDNTMSCLAIDGVDLIGILEMPRYASTEPIRGDWGRLTDGPCRFSGSVYDRTIVVGATSQAGQYDFYRDISVGDAVYFTDVEGHRYSYEIVDMRYASHADKDSLSQVDADLTLFIKNVYDFEYLIVFCNALG